MWKEHWTMRNPCTIELYIFRTNFIFVNRYTIIKHIRISLHLQNPSMRHYLLSTQDFLVLHIGKPERSSNLCQVRFLVVPESHWSFLFLFCSKLFFYRSWGCCEVRKRGSKEKRTVEYFLVCMQGRWLKVCIPSLKVLRGCHRALMY